MFDLPTVSRLAGEKRSHVLTQLHRWSESGRIEPLRRGLYAIGERYRRVPLSPLYVANALCTPSYLSGAWALSYYGLIPEKVTTYTSVTTRGTREYANRLGDFAYHSERPRTFWGYVETPIDGSKVLVAEPEKALLDFLHLERGEWTRDRLETARVQNLDTIDEGRLQEYVARWGSPRLRRAAARLGALAKAQTEGSVVL
jgi:predicted transcriptional regulator of viral defense system